MRITSRRSFLRGASGAALALPWLESLASAGTTPEQKPPLRLGFYYSPIGVVRRGFFPGEGHAGLPAFNGDLSQITESTIPAGSHAIELTSTLAPLSRVKNKGCSDHRAGSNIPERYRRPRAVRLVLPQ